MMSLLKPYLDKLQLYQNLQISLTSVLNSMLTLKPTIKSDYSFAPTETSIPNQIKHWPEGTPILLPLPLWVEPQQGTVELDSEVWRFLFHGSQGLSFINVNSEQEVSIEYTVEGDIGITEWTTQVFLESSNFNEPNTYKLISQHKKLFKELIELGYLVEVPPKILFVEEDVFVFNPNPK